MDETNEHELRQSEHESTVNVDNVVYSSDTVNPIQDDINNDTKLSSNVPLLPSLSSTSTSTINLTRNEMTSDVAYSNECSSLPTTDSQESIKLANSSNLNEKQPEMDCLLEKLRKGMTELSHQGDDFTKQMWNMYATFEDMISGSGQRDDRSRSTLMELSSASSLSINQNSTNSKDSDSKICTVPLTTVVTNVSHSESIDSSSSPETEDQTGKANVNSYKEMSNSQTKESTVGNDTPQLVTSILTGDESGTENSITNSDTNHDKNQKFRPIPVNRNKFLAARQSNIDKPSTNLVGYQSDSGSNSSLANPLLDTISCLTSSDPYSDSDDYDVTRSKVINQRARRRCRRMLSDRSLRCSPNHLHSCCSSDADSIGYAGSNSIDSGYKSLCPTPEVPESISNLLPYKTTEIPSVSDKLQINAQQDNSCLVMMSSHSSSSISALQRLTNLNTISNNSKPHYSDALSKSKLSSIKPHDTRVTSSNCCGPSLTNSTSSNSISSLYNNKMVTRLKNQSSHSQAHLEHLLTLRQSLISAIQKCESSTSTPTDSRVASPVISSRSTSPASTVIPRTVSNLKITPGLASLSVGVIQGANISNQIYQQSSIISGSLSPSSSIAASSNASTMISKSKRLPATASPEPWYSQNHYSPLASYHQNGHSTLNCTRYNRTNNPPSQNPDHQFNEPVLTSSAVSTDVGRVTPTQLPSATSLDVIGQQQHYSSSSLTSLSSSSSFNKSVRFDEVMITPFTNYQPATLNISSNTPLEIADYPIQPTERPISLAATNTSSAASVTVTSGHLNTISSGSSISLTSSINDNRVNGNTDSNNSNNIINNDNINKHISNSNNSNSIYNGIGSSSSIKSSAVTFSTKSILKDPICANLRSSIESGMFNPAQSLENEIDSLLYGKRFNDSIALPTTQITSNDPEFTSLSTLKESTDLYKQVQDDPLDIPYVKMIEEKYRAGNKINKTKSQEHATETFTSYTENTNNHHPSDPMSLEEGINEINLATYQSESSNYLYHKNLNHSGSQVSSNRQNGKYQKQRPIIRNGLPTDGTDAVLDPMSKSKISEMAKCMLGILDEIEMKNSIENRLPKLETVRLREKSYTNRTKERSRPNSAEFRSSIELVPNLFNNGETPSESSYHSLPEYHIYEEVAYDYMTDNHSIRCSPNTVKEAPVTTSQPVQPRERTTRRILPPNPIGSMTMLNNSRITGKSGLSLYRSSLKDLLKPCDGNKNPRLTANVNINEDEVTLNGNNNCHLETELKCFRSSSSSPLSSMRTSSLINSNPSWGRVTEQTKQRGNLYSLFTDPNQRINIGRSLRKELNYNQPRSTIHLELCNQMDGSSSSSEYGFKNN